MPERTHYAPGTPGWVDIGTDIEAAKAFYGGLFGWDSEEAPGGEEAGGYGFFVKNGKHVAGYGPKQNPGPPFWATYVYVEDAADTTKLAEKAGGTVVMPPMDVMDAGTMAVFQDPEGAFISVFQPKTHGGAELVNEHGTLTWNELNTRDLDGAKAFYSQVFGWDPVTRGEGQGAYTEVMVDGKSVGGMMTMPPMVPAEVPPHWLVYFAVDDTDAAIARCEELGGSKRVGPMDIEPGRFAILADPQGATFAVLKLAKPVA